ncbi:hypothetical protein EDD86DRAFT_246133 [Gorgonomyces haynaldii]|nr:hypothetical protein EDD86DRAFT_246133 [Gorgonomyces haynaldii]
MLFNTLNTRETALFLSHYIHSLVQIPISIQTTKNIYKLLSTLSNSITKPMYLCALLLLERSICRNYSWAQENVTLCFCIALVTSQKILKDHAFRNAAWSKIISLPASTISQLEREFLSILDYQLFVDPLEFSGFQRRISLLANIFVGKFKPVLLPPLKTNLRPLVQELTPVTPKRRISFDCTLPAIRVRHY